MAAGNTVKASRRGIPNLDDSEGWALWRLASVLIEIAQSESGESETEAPPSVPPRASALPKVESGG